MPGLDRLTGVAVNWKAEMFAKKLRIDQTWNGEPVSLSEQAHLFMGLDEDGLHLQVEAPFYNDPSPTTPPGLCPGLWDYEVVELFLLGAGGHYLEIELGPHGHYLVYYLSDVRQVERVVEPVSVHCTVSDKIWLGAIHIGLADLPKQLSHVNGYGVSGQGHTRRFLAAAPVPGEAPDFHQPDVFVPLAGLLDWPFVSAK